MHEATFQWDASKNDVNQVKHGISFFEAQRASLNPDRIIAQISIIPTLKSVIIALENRGC
jgi:uncharacterized DUF497 family protein